MRSMQIPTLRALPYKVNGWRILVGLSILTVMLVLAVEFFYELDGTLKTVLEFAELGALLVLFVDLAVNFSRAESKMKFLKQYWFEILLFLPFTAVFRAFRAYEMFQVMGIEAMPFLMRTEILVRGTHAATEFKRSEPAMIMAGFVIGLASAPDRYKTMRYRGLLSF